MLTNLLCSLAVAKPLILAHYMPWYSAPPQSEQFGWHWTMNHFEPKKGQFASHYTPSIGPYDSSDPDVIEYQILTMKIAGIDGVIIDWYGTEDVFDYKLLHQNTAKFIAAAEKLNLKFAICYEDQSIKNAVEQKKITANQAEQKFGEVIKQLKTTWFKSPKYVHLNGEPILLIFGPQYFNKDQMQGALAGQQIQTFGVLGPHDSLTGGFGWPEPQGGHERSFDQLKNFYQRAEAWPQKIAVAYPRFHDIYEQAGVHKSHGSINDNRGDTFQETLNLAVKSNAPIIQIATWNDWGEGTQIEPSKEYGIRDLQKLQSFRRTNIDPNFKSQKDHLNLPIRLYNLRRKNGSTKLLDQIRDAINNEDFKVAENLLASLENEHKAKKLN